MKKNNIIQNVQIDKKCLILILVAVASAKNCLLLKDQKCGVKKVIIDIDYATFPYKIKIVRCIGSCSNLTNPYSKVCVPDVDKNISVKVFDLISQQNKLRKISFQKSCKCECLLNETVCNDKQRWNKDECRCECLKIENYDINSLWNIVNCRCEHKKAAKLMVEEECDEIADDVLNNKTVSIIKNRKL